MDKINTTSDQYLSRLEFLTSKFITLPLYGLGLMLLIVFNGCAPVFSEMQSARTVGLNKLEITPSASIAGPTEDGSTDIFQNHIGFQAAYGITAKTDLRLRYEYIWLKDDGFSDGLNVVGFGPKFNLLENKISFYMPLGMAFGKNSDDYAWQLHPTMLFTLPAIENKLELNFSTKYLMVMDERNAKLFAFNISPTFGTDLKQWCIRPEYGILFEGGEKGFYNQFSIGFTYAFSKALTDKTKKSK